MLPISWHTQPQIHTQKVLLNTHIHKIYDTLTLSLINKIKYTMMYVAKIKSRGKIRKQNRKEEFAKWHHLLFTKINSKTLRRWKGYKIKEWWRMWEGGSGEESMLEYVQSLKCFLYWHKFYFKISPLKTINHIDMWLDFLYNQHKF